MFKSALKIALVGASFALPFTNVLADGHKKDLDSIIAGDHRSEANIARDQYRNPKGVIEFFGITPSMKVAEIWPGGRGYFTEILGPYLAHDGLYAPVVSSITTTRERTQADNQTLYSRWAETPELYGSPLILDINANDPHLNVEEEFDMILTFRNLHNWTGGNYADAFIQSMHKALKSGGRVGVVDHRLDGSPNADKGIWGGYMTEGLVTEIFERNGFKLVAKSEVNANPKDTKDYNDGVWTLPPSYRLGDTDRAKYAAIGESDRMTLLFEKVE